MSEGPEIEAAPEVSGGTDRVAEIPREPEGLPWWLGALYLAYLVWGLLYLGLYLLGD